MATRAKTIALKAAETISAAPRLAINDVTLNELGLDLNTWKVLTESIFPSAKTAEGILLAVRYCQARGLDVLKRPVHVVPMFSRALGHDVETIWPGINEVQITAARTREWAGVDPAKFGLDVTRVFEGRAKTDSGWQDLRVELTYPEWAEVTVYRMINGVRCPFSETVFWEEAYSRAAGGDVPTAMWIRRPRGQLLKCAKAASLRAAFPEEASYTAEEMAGKVIEPEELVISEDTQPVEAEVVPLSPKPEPQTAKDASQPVAPEIVSMVESLIERASRTNAWAAAGEYFRKRFQAADLEYALNQLAQAEKDSIPEAKAA